MFHDVKLFLCRLRVARNEFEEYGATSDIEIPSSLMKNPKNLEKHVKAAKKINSTNAALKKAYDALHSLPLD